MKTALEKIEYYKFFYETVSGGLICGLKHPIEWIVNMHRTPGGTLSEDYYTYVEFHVPQYLYELFQWTYFFTPISAQEILEMCDDYYKNNLLCKGYFHFLTNQIQKYIEENKDEEKK